MKATEQIEILWRDALSAHFYPRQGKEPAAILICFAKPESARDGYILLLENFKNTENTLVINKIGKTVSVSIVYKKTADTIKLDGLSYNEAELTNFIQSQPNGNSSKYMIMVALLSKGKPIAINPYNPPQVYVGDGYIITE